jgi:hypothetical protein
MISRREKYLVDFWFIWGNANFSAIITGFCHMTFFGKVFRNLGE